MSKAGVGKLCEQVFQALDEPLLVVDAKGRIQLANVAAASLLRLSQANARALSDLLHGDASIGEEGDLHLALRRTLAEGSVNCVSLLWARCGERITVAAVPLPARGRVLLRLSEGSTDAGRDAHFVYPRQYDPVTGLPGRALLLDRVAGACARAQRFRGCVVVLYAGIDRFKYFNEIYGRAGGDRFLRQLARALTDAVRECDTVARAGADEFAVVLEGKGVDEHAERIARKMLDAIGRPIPSVGGELFFTASLGIAASPDERISAEDLLQQAELSMYRAKAQGRNTVCRYRPDLNQEAVHRLQLEADLGQALAAGQFELYFQPLIDSGSGSVVAVEALMRWRHPQRGLVAPDHFIPVLEDTNLILPVGRWVLEQACSQVLLMERQFGESLAVAVNISAKQFCDERFAETVAAVLAATGLAAERLHLELTETVLMEASGDTESALLRLQALGVRISIDDFGTGYSSLAYLKRFPVHTLKIDRSFIRGTPEDADDCAIVTAIIALAQQLKLKIVAEAVETQAQLDFVKSWPDVVVQGYLYSPPLPVAELGQWFASRSV